MFPTSTPVTRYIYVLVNVTLTLFLLLGLFVAVNWDDMPNGVGEFLAIRITVKNLIVTSSLLFFWAAAFCAFGLSKSSPRAPFWKELIRATKVCSVAALLALVLPITSRSGAFSSIIVLYFLPTAIAACLCSRFAAESLTTSVMKVWRGDRNLIIVGSGPRAAHIYEQALSSGHGSIRVLGFVDSPNGHLPPFSIRQRMLGSLDELESILMKQPVDEVLIALPTRSCYAQAQTAIKTCERVGVQAKYLADVFELSLARPEFEPGDRSSVVSLKVVQDDYRLFLKRCIDLAGAVAGLTILGLPILAVAVAIRMTNSGPALFVQERYGLNRRKFRMYKFRTMVLDAEKLQAEIETLNESEGPVFKIRNDPRVTRLGRLLRKTSLDELPQLLNVLKGEMSLVGPRPLPKRDVSLFDDASLMRRFSVKPGLTGLWQVSGRSNTGFGEWIVLDLRYIDTWTLALDFKILLKTVPTVLAKTGAV